MLAATADVVFALDESDCVPNDMGNLTGFVATAAGSVGKILVVGTIDVEFPVVATAVDTAVAVVLAAVVMMTALFVAVVAAVEEASIGGTTETDQGCSN